MLDKSTLDVLPLKEKGVYEQLKMLSLPEKELLNILIRNVDKNGVVLYTEESNIMQSLIRKAYVIKNEAYHGKGYSYFVLTGAPHLLNALHSYSQTHHKKPDWRHRLKELLSK